MKYTRTSLTAARRYTVADTTGKGKAQRSSLWPTQERQRGRWLHRSGVQMNTIGVAFYCPQTPSAKIEKATFQRPSMPFAPGPGDSSYLNEHVAYFYNVAIWRIASILFSHHAPPVHEKTVYRADHVMNSSTRGVNIANCAIPPV